MRKRRRRATEKVVANVEIERIAAGGNGIGRVNGLACFVPRAAPGDMLAVEMSKHGRFATGRILTVLRSSEHRVEPQCVHYDNDYCGGCQLQHMTLESQQHARVTIVRDALARIGKRDVATPPLVSGRNEWGYRRRLTLTLVRNASGGYVGGMHQLNDASSVFDLVECRIAHELLVEAWGHIRAYTQYLPQSHTLRFALRLRDDKSVAAIVEGGDDWPNALTFVRRVTDSIKTNSGGTLTAASLQLWWKSSASDSAVRVDRDSAEKELVDDAFAFVQVNSEVAELLRGYVASTLESRGSKFVVDAYAGAGELTELLARAGVRVTSIELDHRATERAALRAAALHSGEASNEAAGGASKVLVLTGAVEDLLPQVLFASGRGSQKPLGESYEVPDAAVVNPPRRGLDAAVVECLDESRTLNTLIYVSCDPATLARDLAGLHSWRVSSVRCFDMFPQTSHVETVCVLERSTLYDKVQEHNGAGIAIAEAE